MAIDLSGIPNAPAKIDLSTIPDAPKHSGIDLSGIPDAQSQPNDALTRLETAFSGPDFGLFSHPIEVATGKSNEQRAVDAFSQPATSRPFDKNLTGAPTALKLAAFSDNVTSPINLLPVPALEAGGALLEGIAPGAAKWLAEQTKNINPAWNAELNPTPVNQGNIVDAINTQSTPAPQPDQNPEYQAWLQQNAQPTTPQNPIMDVPLHPPDEAKVALAQIPVELPGQNGQLGFRGFPQAPETPGIPANTPDYLAAIEKYQAALPKPDQGQQQFDFTKGPEVPAEQNPVVSGINLGDIKKSLEKPAVQGPSSAPQISNPLIQNIGLSDIKKALEKPAVEPPAKTVQLPGKQLGFSDIINRKTLKIAPEVPATLPEEPFGPFREQGQQQFDFTKGPPQSLKELRAKLLDPNISDAEFKQTQQKIQEASVPDRTNTVVQEPIEPPKLNPRDAAKQKLSFNTLKNAVAEYKSLSAKDSLSAVDELRLEELAGNITKLKKSVSSEQLKLLKDIKAPTPEPSALEDAATILLGLNKRGSTGGGRFTPEAEAAIKRFRTQHGPELAEHLKTAGNTAESFVASKLPKLSAPEVQFLAKALSAPQKIGNLNLTQYPEEQKQQLRDMFAGQEEKLQTKPITREQILEKSKDLTSLPVTEAIGRNEAGQTAAEITRRTTSDIAKMKAIAEDPNLSTHETIQRILQVGTEKTKKVKTEIGRALGSMNVPLEAQEEQLTAMRKIVDRLRSDPKLTSVESQDLIRRVKGQFPDLKSVTTADVVKEVFRNFITSSPVTWGVNAISNYGNILSRPAMRTLEVSAAKVRSLMSGQPTTAKYKEIGAMLHGMGKAISGSKLPDALKSKTFSDKYNVSSLDTLAAGAKTKLGQEALGVTSKVINAPSNVMRAADEHAKNIMGMMEMYAAKARGENVFDDQNAIHRITNAQARGSFQDEMSGIGKWIAQARNYYAHQPPTALNQAGDIFTYVLQPFVQTVDRIIAGGINNSILGGVTTGVKAVTGKYTGALAKGIGHDPIAAEKLDRDLAAVMIGTPLFIWTGMQLANGNLSGAAPQDVAGREAFTSAGKQDYDLKVGNRRIPIRLLPEPMATAMQINTALIQGLAEAKDKEQGVSSGVFKAVTNIGYMLGTKQYLGGMNSLVNAVAGKDSSGDVVDPNDVTNAANRNPIIKKILPSAAVPSIVKDIGVVKDTLQNRPRVMADTAIEATKRRAGLTSGMVPELNTFGEPVTHQSIGRVENNPAYALAEKIPPQPVARVVDGVKLSQQDYHDLKQSVGQQRKKVYEALANNPKFMQSSDGLQQVIMKDLISTADNIGSIPEKVRELKSDPMYYDNELRTLLQIKKPGGARHFPYLK